MVDLKKDLEEYPVEQSFTHQVDKKAIPTCPILGVNLAAIDMPWLLAFTEKHLGALSGDYICVSNVHTTVTAWKDEAYRAVQNGGILAIPDGGPLSSTGRKRGYESMRRVTGPDYMLKAIELGLSKGWRHYFYGSTPETLEKMEKTLRERYPDIQIAGTYSPPFRALSPEEDGEIVEKINKTAPDFVWVGLGAPKQEIWMGAHQGKLHGLMVGVGAAFDYTAGNISRAPQWMQKHNLEWLYRLMQDPKRLFKRYFVTNTTYIIQADLRGK